MFKLKIFHKGLILVSVPLIFEIVFVLVLVNLLQQAEAEVRREARAKDIIAKIDLMRRTWTDCGLAVGFFKWTGNPMARARYRACVKLIREEAANAKELVKGNPKEEQLMDIMIANTEPALKSMQRAMQARGDLAFGAMFSSGRSEEGSDGSKKNPMLILRKAGDRLFEIETRVAEISPAERAQTRRMIQQALFGGLAANVVLTIILTFYLSKSITSRLACVTDNTQKLAKRQTLNLLVKGQDEIAVLDNCLHKTATELAELENFKREMMSMVSHELRTPLSSVVLILKLLSEGALGDIPEKALNRIKVAENNADRLIRLINDLLDIDRMEAGKLEMTFRETSMDSVLDQSVEYVKEFAQKTDVTILREGSAGSLTVDHERLVQVVINLLSNAIKYSPEGGTIKLISIESPEFIEIKVVDQGRGIPADFTKKIFEKFQQVDQSVDAREKKGSGLGLAICKAIIEQHSGEIGVESELSKGSTFWFRLPRSLKLSADSPAEPERITLK